ncbi:hypothetical protein CPAV1605_339 [seawater metagenome]|uniref:RING-type domain-containing protein n=1 Tax=seawater metagenome TaxID=1561972 RepID=A0A5E8CIW9_9ZZZZ
MVSNTCSVNNCRFPKTHVTLGHLCGKCKKYGHGQMECGDQKKIDELKNASQYDRIEPETYCKIPQCNSRLFHTTSAHHCKICFGNHSEGLHNLLTNNIISTDYIVKCPICRTKNKVLEKQKLISGITEKCSICLTNNVQIYFPKCGHVCVCNDCCKKLENKNENHLQIVSEYELPSDIVEEAKRKFGNLPGKIYCKIYAGMGCCWYIRRSNNQEIEGFFMHSDSWGQYGPNTDDSLKLEEFYLSYYDIK